MCESNLLEAVGVRLDDLGREHSPADVARALRELGVVVSDDLVLRTFDQLRHSDHHHEPKGSEMNAFEAATQNVTMNELAYVGFAVVATDRTGEVIEAVACFTDRVWDARWTAREMLNFHPGVTVEIVAKDGTVVFTQTNYED